MAYNAGTIRGYPHIMITEKDVRNAPRMLILKERTVFLRFPSRHKETLTRLFFTEKSHKSKNFSTKARINQRFPYI